MMFGVRGLCYMPAACCFLVPPHTASAEECAVRASEREERRGRRQKQQAKQSQLTALFVCVSACCAARTLAATHDAPRSHLAAVSSQRGGMQDASRLTVVAENQYFPPSHAGLFRWQEIKNGQALARCAGAADERDPQHFFRSAAIRNRFPTISLQALLTQSNSDGNKNCSNDNVVACDCVFFFFFA